MAGKTFPLSLVVKAVDQATGPLAKIGEQVSGLAKSTARVGAGLTLGLTAPLVGLGTVGVAAFSKFEAGMANVSTLVDTSVESMAGMEVGVIAVTRAVKVQPLSEMAEALASIRGAGISAADQFKVLEGSAKLAAAALGTTAEASDIATSAIKSWNLEGKDAANVYNQVFQAVNFGKMNLSQFAQGFGDVASVAAGAGVKFDEYASSVAALTTAGTKASTAHTQLRAVIAGLTNQSKEAAAIFQRLGVKDFKTLIQQAGGLVPALEKIRGVVKGNDMVLIKALGGAEAYAATIALTGNLAETQKQALGTMRSGVDGLTGAWEKQTRTGKATMQDFQNQLEIVAISIGRVLVPVLQQLTPLLERAAGWWEGLGESGQASMVALAAGAAALGPALTVLGHLTTAFHLLNSAVMFSVGWGKYLWMMRASIMASLVPSLAAAASAVWGFTAALLANPITWVVAGVALLAGAAYLIYKNWGPIKAWFAGLWAAIKVAFDIALKWIGKNLGWTPLGMVINNWEPIKAYFIDLWESISSTFKAGWEKVKPIVDLLANSGVIGLAVRAGGAVMDAVSGPADTAAAADAVARYTPQPMLGAERVAQATAAQSEARVTVDFSNLPRGARVTPARDNTADLDLGLGYAMVNP